MQVVLCLVGPTAPSGLCLMSYQLISWHSVLHIKMLNKFYPYVHVYPFSLHEQASAQFPIHYNDTHSPKTASQLYLLSYLLQYFIKHLGCCFRYKNCLSQDAESVLFAIIKVISKSCSNHNKQLLNKTTFNDRHILKLSWFVMKLAR